MMGESANVESTQRRVALVVANGDARMGLSIADRLVRAGHDVVLVGDNGDAVTLPWNLSGLDAAGVARSVKDLIVHVPKADILVIATNAPGETSGTSTQIEFLKSSDWNSVVLANLTAAFLVVKAYISDMQKQRWGRVIFVVPEEIRARPDGANAPFIASKAGLVGLARTLVHELGPDQVTVNCVASGMGPSRSPADIDREGPHVTARPPGPADAAEAVAFFASEGAAFITGMTLDVNGGRAML